jgi:hypothetical protein
MVAWESGGVASAPDRYYSYFALFLRAFKREGSALIMYKSKKGGQLTVQYRAGGDLHTVGTMEVNSTWTIHL